MNGPSVTCLHKPTKNRRLELETAPAYDVSDLQETLLAAVS